MGKDIIITETETKTEFVQTELERLHPEEGDVFILNVNTDDPEIIYSEDIANSVEQLSEILHDLTGLDIPILVFGTELNMSLMKKDDLLDMLDTIEGIEAVPTAADADNETDSENLTDLFD